MLVFPGVGEVSMEEKRAQLAARRRKKLRKERMSKQANGKDLKAAQ